MSKSGQVVSKLDSRLEDHPILDGNGVKAMPGSIPALNPGSFNNWKERKILYKDIKDQSYKTFKSLFGCLTWLGFYMIKQRIITNKP